MLYVLVRIAGERIALPAAIVESVVELDIVTPAPRVAPHIAGLAALRSRVVTVIDVRVALGLAPAPRKGVEAVIVTLDGHSYGLIVDAVEDVGEAGRPLPLAAPVAGGWGAAAAGMAEMDGQLVLVADPAALIAPRDADPAVRGFSETGELTRCSPASASAGRHGVTGRVDEDLSGGR